MKTLLVFLMLALSLRANAAEWLTDLPAALKKAREEGKTVLLDFTGSDWCIWCKRLKSEVFDKPEFQQFADANLVLVEVDFPHGKKLSPALINANNYLMKRFGVEGFPTVILLDQDDKYLGKTGYLEGGPKAFVSELERIPTVKRRDPGTPTSSTGPTTQPAPTPPEIPKMPGPAAKIEYRELALKAISGTKQKRLALINNQSFAQGETAMVKLGDTKLKVLCQEIREDSVLLQVEGKAAPVELTLRSKTTIEAISK